MKIIFKSDAKKKHETRSILPVASPLSLNLLDVVLLMYHMDCILQKHLNIHI